jgi:hypothetical protein
VGADPFGRCPVCGEPIGAYEPLAVVLPEGTVLRGGLTVLPEDAERGMVHHESCFDTLVSLPE